MEVTNLRARHPTFSSVFIAQTTTMKDRLAGEWRPISPFRTLLS
jgi:hypothetical protein